MKGNVLDLANLAGVLKINKIVSPVSNVVNSVYPLYQGYNNKISDAEATYDVTTSIITTIVAARYGPGAGFILGSGFEITKVGFKNGYEPTEQWATPYINQFNNWIISIPFSNN